MVRIRSTIIIEMQAGFMASAAVSYVPSIPAKAKTIKTTIKTV